MGGKVKVIMDRGIFTDRGKPVAGPGEGVLVERGKAEELVRDGKAHYPPRR